MEFFALVSLRLFQGNLWKRREISAVFFRLRTLKIVKTT